MKIVSSPLPKSQVKLEIELTQEEFDKYKDQAVRNLSARVKIPGFRPGKAPYNILIQHIGEEHILHTLIELALPQTYFKAIKDQNLQVISKPEIKVITEKPLKYEANVAILPEIKIKDLSKIKIPKKEINVAEQDVKKEIEELRKRYGVYKEHNREIKNEDKVEIDFQGFDLQGKKVPNTDSKNHPVIVGGGSLIPGFEKELLGLKKGDKKEFTLTFPKDYHKKDFQNKKVKFAVEIKKTEELILPEINEEFIQKVMGKKSSQAEFEAKVKEIMQKSEENKEKTNRENQLLNKIIEISDVEIPDILVNEEVDFMLEDLRMSIAEKGLKFEDYLKYIKKDEAQIKKEMKEEAEKRIKLRLVLNHIFKEEKMEPEEAEINKKLEEILKYEPKDHHSHFEKGEHGYVQLVNKLKLDKLFKKYLAL